MNIRLNIKDVKKCKLLKLKHKRIHSERTLNTDPAYLTNKGFLESKPYPFFPRR